MKTYAENCQPPDCWRYSGLVWRELVGVFSEQANSGLAPLDSLKCVSSWSSISSGKSNNNYRLTLTNKRYFVQLVDPVNLVKTPSGCFVPVYQLLNTHNKLARWTVPCLYESPRLRVFEWVEGVQMTPQELTSKNNFDEILSFLVSLHQSKLNLPTLDIREHITKYCNQRLEHSQENRMLKDLLSELNSDLPKIFSASAPCHHDLSPENLIFADRLYVLDWEYAANSDPLMDLAWMSINFNLSDAQERYLLTQYQKLAYKPLALEHYPVIKRISKAINQVWSL